MLNLKARYGPRGLNNVLPVPFFCIFQLTFYGQVVNSGCGGHKLIEKEPG